MGEISMSECLSEMPVVGQDTQLQCYNQWVPSSLARTNQADADDERRSLCKREQWEHRQLCLGVRDVPVECVGRTTCTVLWWMSTTDSLIRKKMIITVRNWNMLPREVAEPRKI